MKFLNSQTHEDERAHPYKAEFYVGLIFVFLLGFVGVQKVSQTSFEPIAQSLCSSGVTLPYVNCQSFLQESNQQDGRLESTKPQSIQSFVAGLDQSPDAPSLREQFAHIPKLVDALKQLKWNGGDEQEAARFLSVMVAIENSHSESSGIPSSMSSLLDEVWNQYPDLVATSHCLECNRFYQQILKPYFNEGTKNYERFNQIASGHPRFLQAIYKSGQLTLKDVQQIAKLQAELLTSEDAETAKFIGNILIKNQDLDALHQWSSKGWNGSYAVSDYHKMLKLPRYIIIDAWERGVLKGADNAEITRFLVSTGYRPALRWLLWVHAGNLKYFQNTAYQAEKDRYNDLILSLHVDFPAGSKDDLTGFYSKNWKNIAWDSAKKKWILKG